MVHARHGVGTFWSFLLAATIFSSEAQMQYSKYGRRQATRLRAMIHAGLQEWEERHVENEPPLFFDEDDALDAYPILPRVNIHAFWFILSLRAAVHGVKSEPVRRAMPCVAHAAVLS